MVVVFEGRWASARLAPAALMSCRTARPGIDKARAAGIEDIVAALDRGAGVADRRQSRDGGCHGDPRTREPRLTRREVSIRPRLPLVAFAATLAGLGARKLRLSHGWRSESAIWTLGWLPDFFYALGVAAAVLAVQEWLGMPTSRRWPAVAGFLVVPLTNEFRSAWGARGTFDWADVCAFVVGAVVAVAIDRYRPDASNAGAQARRHRDR